MSQVQSAEETRAVIAEIGNAIDQAALTPYQILVLALIGLTIVLDGFELGSDVKEVRYPDRYMDKRGAVMWNKVMNLIGGPMWM